MITIVDLNTGNLASVKNMLMKLNCQSCITSKPDEIASATKIILPGVGSFNEGMKNLKELNLEHILHEKVMVQKTPTLGICLGMQLLCKSSEEGNEPGLGFIDAAVLRFPDSINLRIPHMGWNVVTSKRQTLLSSSLVNPRFYFVHSYYVQLNNLNDELFTTQYGLEFSSAFEHENILGVQFHPEKSLRFGKQLLQNFIIHY